MDGTCRLSDSLKQRTYYINNLSESRVIVSSTIGDEH